ncbi:MAG: 4-alpha-glucanotransferase [Acidobacteria bacterium]|nr:4-alpha-glucanotransferase [Acidobacteriota bacterium]
MSPFVPRRRAGVLIPLFSMPSTRSWGIGEIGDLAAIAPWLRDAGLSLLQLLPVNEMSSGQHSPYSAMSAMAIDPIYISVSAVEEFIAAGGEASLSGEARDRLDQARCATRVEYETVRALKERTLESAFDRFLTLEWASRSVRAAALDEYLKRESWWVDDYTLFRALHARHENRPWTEWETGLRSRDPDALDLARRQLPRERLFYGYLQWLADAQWREARRRLGDIALFGDLPFVVGLDSADVWVHQREFRLDVSAGVPPDAFSETGQEWGLPVYRWDVVEAAGFGWLRQRARRSAALYDGYRVDHLVGFYRTYVFPGDGQTPFFTPAEEDEQIALGEKVLRVLSSADAFVVAEDLGTVPDFVRASLARLGVPGYKVLRWEREWKKPGKPFVPPSSYARVSVATSGTHDTDTMAAWWQTAGQAERAELARLEPLGRVLAKSPAGELTPELRDALLGLLFSSRSDLLILPFQDLFGWTDRINVPATTSADNWTYRLPWPVERLCDQPEAQQRAQALQRVAISSGRFRSAQQGTDSGCDPWTH